MTRREHTTVVIGILIAIVAVSARIVPATTGRLGRWTTEFETRQRLLARSRSNVENADRLALDAEKLRRQMDSISSGLILSTGRAEGLAELSRVIEDRVAGHRTRVVGTRMVTDSTRRGRIERMSLRVELESDWSGLLAAMQAIEVDSPLISIRDLRLQRGNEPAEGPEVLRAELVASAWMMRQRRVK